jgi:alginate O-acetyltransferase complex protein AlgI
MMPQFENARVFDFELAKDGMRQILWVFFKKVVIADPTGVRVNYIHENFDLLNSSNLALGIFLYNFQLHMEFSTYSDLAIGLG